MVSDVQKGSHFRLNLQSEVSGLKGIGFRIEKGTKKKLFSFTETTKIVDTKKIFGN